MNTAHLESLTQLLSDNRPLEHDLTPKNTVSTEKPRKNPDKDTMWDEDEIAESIDVDPRPCPEYFFI